MAEPVFDYSAGTPWVVNETMLNELENALETEDAGAASDSLSEEGVRQFRRDQSFRQTFRDTFDEAGVNLAR